METRGLNAAMAAQVDKRIRQFHKRSTSKDVGGQPIDIGELDRNIVVSGKINFIGEFLDLIKDGVEQFDRKLRDFNVSDSLKLKYWLFHVIPYYPYGTDKEVIKFRKHIYFVYQAINYASVGEYDGADEDKCIVDDGLVHYRLTTRRGSETRVNLMNTTGTFRKNTHAK
jgi:hypothetical protein